jgi:hypothetical protein
LQSLNGIILVIKQRQGPRRSIGLPFVDICFYLRVSLKFGGRVLIEISMVFKLELSFLDVSNSCILLLLVDTIP